MNLSDDQITAGARWLAQNIKRVKWEGLYEGRVRDQGFDPWIEHNARKEDYRDAVRDIIAAMGLSKRLNAEEHT